MAEKINIDKSYESSVGNTVTEVDEINKRKTFSSREVGISHPDNPGFIRITDSGDIEIFASSGVGIVISSLTKTIALFADNIKIHSKEDGLKWNSKEFNSSATVFTEPALLLANGRDFNPGFKNADYYIDSIDQYNKEETQPIVTIEGSYDYAPSTNIFPWEEEQLADSSTKNDIFTQQDLDQISIFWEQNKDKFLITKEAILDEFLKLKELGYTIEQAKARLLEDKNV